MEDLTSLDWQGDDTEPFALIFRPRVSTSRVQFFRGRSHSCETLGAAFDTDTMPTPTRLVAVPYNRLRERGWPYVEDDDPLICIDVEHVDEFDRDVLLSKLPARLPSVVRCGYDIDDETYADMAQSIVSKEISGGDGANFVLARSVEGRYDSFDHHAALAVFRAFLASEDGSYWTFCIFTGETYLIGSTPEQHLLFESGFVSMNPISGTFKYPRSHVEEALHQFLLDQKEIDELHMVVDEELKIMASVCDQGIRVIGPRLKIMSRLAHTEYVIEGKSSLPIADLVRKTLFAPTVTGSPARRACSVIARYEPRGRGYYSGFVGILSHGKSDVTFDSAIVLRTAAIDRSGEFRVTAGSTIVRHSTPYREAAETSAKLERFLTLSPGESSTKVPDALTHPGIDDVLMERTRDKSAFWLNGTLEGSFLSGGPAVEIVDADDFFTSMLAHQLEAIGCRVSIVDWSSWRLRRFHDRPRVVTVIGPGPGNPMDLSDERIVALRQMAASLVRDSSPVVGICLGHQVLASVLGLRIEPLTEASQGRQAWVQQFGERHRVAFYNSYTAVASTDSLEHRSGAGDISICREEGQLGVVSIAGPRLVGVQYHPESFMTTRGPTLLGQILRTVLSDFDPAPPPN